MSCYVEIQKSVHDLAIAGGHTVPTLVAVSKTKSVEEILSVYRLGQKVFGENYVQELIDKSRDIHAAGIRDLQFHFVGRLQRNKVKVLLQHVSMIHSVDSIRLLEEIDQQARNLRWEGGVLLQINIDSEESKAGFMPDDLAALSSWLQNHPLYVRIQGLMCIPDPDKDPASSFARLRQLRDRYASQVGTSLSMGMSSDYKTAIEHGSTHLRIGSAIFGARI